MFWSWNVEEDDDGIVLNEKLLKQLDVGDAIKSRPLWKDGDFGIDWLKLLFTLATAELEEEDAAVCSAPLWISVIITIFSN